MGFLLLLGTTVAVFVALPSWVEERSTVAENPVVGKARPNEPGTAIEGLARAVGGEVADGGDLGPETARAGTRRVTAPRPSVQLPAESRAGPVLYEPRRVEPQRQAFDEAMTAGLRAFEDDEPQEARRALRQAVELDPGSTAAVEGLARAEAAVQTAEIERYRREAGLGEAAEEWRAALAAWEAVLALDPAVEAAQEGAARSRRRAELTEQLDFHLARPERLSADEVMLEVSSLLERAREIVDRGPHLERQISDLGRAIEAAATPVTVTLESDDLTEVEIYRVGRLGKFRRRTLDLRPGTYTVVGRRRGYRDVRRELRVPAGEGSPAPLRILCEEAV